MYVGCGVSVASGTGVLVGVGTGVLVGVGTGVLVGVGTGVLVGAGVSVGSCANTVFVAPGVVADASAMIPTMKPTMVNNDTFRLIRRLKLFTTFLLGIA